MDFTADPGTAIVAAAAGVVVFSDWHPQYGNMIEIDHGNGLTTRYGHMSKIESQVGDQVTRGQLIGYVGSTGLSTGAHVHYEILVNGRFVDPMRIKLPRGRALEGPIMASFEQERDKTDGMMTFGTRVWGKPIGIIGLGYVGLPLACLFAEKGFSVTGFDVDAGKAEKLNAGRSYIRHIPGRRIAPLGQGPARRHGPGLHPSRLDPRAMAAARRARGDSGAGPEEAFDEDE